MTKKELLKLLKVPGMSAYGQIKLNETDSRCIQLNKHDLIRSLKVTLAYSPDMDFIVKIKADSIYFDWNE